MEFIEPVLWNTSRDVVAKLYDPQTYANKRQAAATASAASSSASGHDAELMETLAGLGQTLGGECVITGFSDDTEGAFREGGTNS